MPTSPASSRISIVTGATDGIGRAVAIGLALRGHRLLLVGRNPPRGAQVLDDVQRLAPGRDHAFLATDLASLAATGELARELAARAPAFDSIVLAAGTLSRVPTWTGEGLEHTFAVNYLSRYLLLRLLLPRLGPAGAAVLVGNPGVYPDTLDFADLNHHRGKPGLVVSGRTQIANDLLATELAARSQHLHVACVHPGLTRTRVFANATGFPAPVRWLASGVARVAGHSPHAAAETPVALASQEGPARLASGFYGPGMRLRAVPNRSRDRTRAGLLWQASEEMVRPYVPAGMALG